jgi:hypothetical protein
VGHIAGTGAFYNSGLMSEFVQPGEKQGKISVHITQDGQDRMFFMFDTVKN